MKKRLLAGIYITMCWFLALSGQENMALDALVFDPIVPAFFTTKEWKAYEQIEVEFEKQKYLPSDQALWNWHCNNLPVLSNAALRAALVKKQIQACFKDVSAQASVSLDKQLPSANVPTPLPEWALVSRTRKIVKKRARVREDAPIDNERSKIIAKKVRASNRHLCSYGSSFFTNAKEFAEHLRTTHKVNRPFKCNTCGSAFHQNYLLSKHIKLHSTRSPFKCNECAQSFKTRDALKSHKLTHSTEKMFKCSKCDRSFKHPSSFSRHKRKEHAFEK